jgi:1-acyl-sn-glycerol-3-phosphate acyltransferase
MSNRLSNFLDGLVDDEIHDRMDRMDINFSSFGYDRWGFSRAAGKQALAVARWFYRDYFRVAATGLDNIPAGRVLLIANHSGQLPWDGMLISTAVALEAEPPRFVRAMIELFFANPPWLNVLMSRLGQIIGLPSHARRLLEQDEAAILVFPEGQRGSGRVWRDRYKVLGYSQGFMRLALETKTPIVPVGVIGGEEMCVSFSRMEPLARLFGTPYLPLTPTILPLPLPVKVRLRFGKPIYFEGTGNEEDSVVFAKVAKVEEAVRNLLSDGLAEREGIFS